MTQFCVTEYIDKERVEKMKWTSQRRHYVVGFWL